MVNITTGIANLVCIGFTLIYIAGFYIFKTPGDRNDPPVMRARMKAVIIASIISALIVMFLLKLTGSKYNTAQVLGIDQPSHFIYIFSYLRPLVLTCGLFLGPLSIMYFDQELPFQKHFNFKRDVAMNIMSLLGQRNYIVAPLTEEFVFRACIISVLKQAAYSRTYLIFVSPFYFGIAHLHHAWDKYQKLGKTRYAFKMAMLSSLFQFAYTTLFGWYASYLFLRMGKLWPPVLCHSFCNIMGFPDFNGISHRPTYEKTIIYCCFPIGILFFVYNIDYLTLPSSVGGSIYWK
ncbi:CAAX protease self-immunity-domain-containing protein [Cokeromyces recurvatus]|uniref:CAAX protease self-immunity-domain-containing protein n=1 Tax=Cokeromyces recurvatus TaxID=90255 RepID=UPI00221F7F7D|nr:CAAX protease self-immunity-domain-containing protein [Cokeromyces recurvatus]KAI7907809.1 CAAX protease self-immunity-domain-containing protein [Cokeromyces recurvatus]